MTAGQRFWNSVRIFGTWFVLIFCCLGPIVTGFILNILAAPAGAEREMAIRGFQGFLIFLVLAFVFWRLTTIRNPKHKKIAMAVFFSAIVLIYGCGFLWQFFQTNQIQIRIPQF